MVSLWSTFKSLNILHHKILQNMIYICSFTIRIPVTDHRRGIELTDRVTGRQIVFDLSVNIDDCKLFEEWLSERRSEEKKNRKILYRTCRQSTRPLFPPSSVSVILVNNSPLSRSTMRSCVKHGRISKILCRRQILSFPLSFSKRIVTYTKWTL